MDHLTIRRLSRELLTLGEATFQRRYGVPALVYEGSIAPSSIDEGERAFITSSVDLRAIDVSPADRKTMPPSADAGVVDQSMESRVFLIRKRAGGAFAERIGIGRAANADVSVPLATVSKYHAYFTVPETPDTPLLLTDAGSTNGTRVDGRPLAERQAVPVRTGTQVTLGPHRFVFYSAAALAERVRRAASQPKSRRVRTGDTAHR